MNSIGFPNTDLYHDNETAGGESFWPSFTDIMMVIVMAFLLVTVSVILNNWQLVQNLKQSVAAEQQSAIEAQKALALMQTKQSENETLEQRLVRLEGYISLQTDALTKANLQLNQKEEALVALKQASLQQETQLSTTIKQHEVLIAQLNERLTNRDKALAASELKINTLNETVSNAEQALSSETSTLTALSQKLSEITTQNAQLQQVATEKQALEAENAELQTKVEEIDILTNELMTRDIKISELLTHIEALSVLEESVAEKDVRLLDLRTELDKARTDLEKATTQLSSQQTELEQLRNTSSDEDKRLAVLQDQYDTLDEEYQKLVRPARSSNGKKVATVVYRKNRGGKQYQIQAPDAGSSRSVNKGQLDTQLNALKEKYGQELYIKIVIPENSGLSYNEAWLFTKEMLNTYDYYHQENEPVQ